MKILIDIPKEFEVDYNTDRFAEFFHRCLADMGTCCGNYEFETAEMMEKAFAESKIYDQNKIVEQLNDKFRVVRTDEDLEWNRAMDEAITIVNGGGLDGN